MTHNDPSAAADPDPPWPPPQLKFECCMPLEWWEIISYPIIGVIASGLLTWAVTWFFTFEWWSP